MLEPLSALIGGPSTPALLQELAALRPQLCAHLESRLGHPLAAKALTVKALNLALARHELLTRAVAPQSRPYGLTLDPANGCALQCPGCVHSVIAVRQRLFDWPAGMLDEALFAGHLRRYGPYAVQAMFYNYGEPLLNPQTPALIALARRYLVETVISTSLSVRHFDAEAYVRSGLQMMALSIDGASQAVYEQFRRNGKLDVVIENVRRLVSAKRALGSEYPVLRWQYLAFEHNAHEIETAIELARELGVDEFLVARPFDVSWDDNTLRAASVPRRHLHLTPRRDEPLTPWTGGCGELDAKAIEEAYAHRWQAPASEGTPGPTCRWLYKNTTIDARGRMFPCCGAPEPGGDLIFANAADNGDTYQTAQPYQLARLFFADRPAYDERLRVLPDAAAPYCARCSFVDQPAAIDRLQVANYLRSFGNGLFPLSSVRLLSEW